ncbi:head-tail adaptor protein [Sphingomonas sp.]|uniref:head-tail adaptor protein n=1 Tax=Sphingomonas sp. TaxID=28214 RepID=UPI003AFF76D2
MSFTIAAGDLDRIVTFQRKAVPTDDAMDAGEEIWSTIDGGEDVWAQVQEMLPSRGERLSDGMVLAARPARVRIRYRDDITPDMRVIYGSRVMQIITPPIELGRREGLEFMAQDYSTAGGG